MNCGAVPDIIGETTIPLIYICRISREIISRTPAEKGHTMHRTSAETIRKYKALYRFLNRFDPISSDCGFLCGAACCQDADGELGIYMLPGEELLHREQEGFLTLSEEDAAEFDFPESWGPVIHLAACPGPARCIREIRPVQCRTFPLMPYITEEGALEMIYNDNELPYECPLIKQEIPLNDDFVRATRTAWKHLLRDPRIRDLVLLDSEALREAMEEQEDR